MTPAVWAWIVSSTGALLFFAAGSLLTLRTSAARVRGERNTREREHAELERALLEREQLRAAVAEAKHEQRALAAAAKERDRLRASHAAMQKTACEANARADQAWREVAEVVEQLRGKREPSERPSVPDAGASGEVLRTILERETRGSGVTGAVITDELGLVVASTGEYGDALAAYGAFLASMSAKTRDALPLRELRQMTIQDDHDTTLTVRPIASTEANLALVTLAAGQRSASASSSPER